MEVAYISNTPLSNRYGHGRAKISEVTTRYSTHLYIFPDGLSFRRNKVMDKSLPPSLSNQYEDYKLYEELSNAERKLDWTVSRKRAELQDALSRSHTVGGNMHSKANSLRFRQAHKVLRVFVSHRCSGQSWQTNQNDPESQTIDFQSGEGIPSWTLKVEGRVLQESIPPQVTRLLTSLLDES